MAPGDLVAERFRLLTQAAKGGTATVYRAFDMERNTLVALKLFDGPEQSDHVKADICSREAKALERLDHELIVKLVHSGRCSACHCRYIAVEWIDGKTLEEHLEALGPIPWKTFLEGIGTDLLGALCHTFERDISHRDVSLRNVLVAEDGRIRLIDFGQAKLNAIGIGTTLAGWKTPPYSPPEEDTGRYTLTRDPYSFAAIAVRACAGKALANHDQLYDQLAQMHLDEAKPLLEKALHRDPKLRFENIASLRDALQHGIGEEIEEGPLKIAIRFLPAAFKWVQDPDAFGVIQELESKILDELNEAAAVRLLNESDARTKNRIQIETVSHRLVVDIDATQRDHLVVIGAAVKRFSLEGLYKGDAWMANAIFRPVGPTLAKGRAEARAAVAKFYESVESALVLETAAKRGDSFLGEWSRVLDAMREVESERVPPLRYRLIETSGRRIVVDVENPWDAREEQIRTISRPGSMNWVFKGEIESIEGKRCTLYSRTFSVRPEEIPTQGLLSHEWSQSRKALDRQADAIKSFRSHETPSEAVRKLLLREDPGKTEPRFSPVKHFFDSTLNDEKKLLVSQFLASQDLLLVHGPPGTGKTKLIVEIIQQELRRDPSAKILLVSQTHVALDHALLGLVGPESQIPAVRIASGVKPIGPAVQHCTVEARGRQLQSDVEKASRNFLAEEAARVGVDYGEVDLGIRASEVLRLRALVKEFASRCARLESEIAALAKASNDLQSSGSTTRRDENRTKLRALNQDLERENDELILQKGQLEIATNGLADCGKEGKELSKLDDGDLSEWCDLLLHGPAKARLRKLIGIAEEWRLKFATSDDFKAAIIASSRIVAGTCVGFCREAAAAASEYDLCIVDEASKATTTELLLPLSRCKRGVLVGDHHQLPPFVEYALKSESLKQKHNLSADIFEAQLFETLQKELPEGQKGKLRYQYRMRDGIGRLVSQCFYKGELESGLDPNEEQIFGDLTLAGLAKHVVWYNTPVAERQEPVERKVGTSYVNMPEVDCIVDLLVRLDFLFRGRSKKTRAPSIGVVSGYIQQVETLRREIGRRTELAKLDIECNSVHTFQGREVDICIYSITRNNGRGDVGFLTDWRHLNVALSRARWYLVIVGSLPFCSSVRGENPFAEVLKFVSTDAECEVK